ncbi:hypothetical protein PAP_03315 [Palaeococcus pacificus DY20341]|uniref:Flavodoxin-like domain-containing protein n=1 Tax=Palaeococcus pacificus DY20341 TaxID=1343739 RepID=A0A075LX10_9EURY|nr:FprA family A-type flavoprotein [Palaeococcus pacificus]AIF69083.1 hypothetical protein PAP_03315 [Palaeococcus pacificus DY20341]
MGKVWIEEISDGLYVLRVDDDQTKYFEAMWDIPEGITYNAYLMKTGDAVVLFDAWKKTYEKEFIEALSSIVDPKEITHIVVHHMEPDHSGALPKVLELNGYKAQILGTTFVEKLIEAFYGIKVNFRPVKDGEEIKIGEKTFRFIHVPWLHWPDTMITYVIEDGIFFGGDVCGGYSIPPALFDDDEEVVQNYLPHVRKYIINVIGHYKKYIHQNIEKIKSFNLDLKLIAPAHGLIWRKNPAKIIEFYEQVGRGIPTKGKVLVVYSSMYGFVEKAVSVAVDEVKKLGYNPVVYKFTDTERANISDILGDVPDSEAIIIGTATYEADIFPMMRFTLDEILDKANYEKPVLVLTTFGWGGIAGKKIESLFSKTKFNVIETMEIKGLLQKGLEKKVREGVGKLLGIK